MSLLNRACVLFLFKLLMLVGCYNDSDKSKVDQLNKDKFSGTEKSDAAFLVNSIDKSYGLLEVAQLGEEKLSDSMARAKVRQFIQTQTSVSVKLKSFAEENDVSVPFSGPEKTKSRIEKLHSKNGSDFDETWYEEIKKSHESLIKDIKNYRERSALPLQQFLDSTLVVLNKNGILLADIEQFMKHKSHN